MFVSVSKVVFTDIELRGSPELSSFSQAYTEYAGGGGQWPPYAF